MHPSTISKAQIPLSGTTLAISNNFQGKILFPCNLFSKLQEILKVIEKVTSHLSLTHTSSKNHYIAIFFLLYTMALSIL